MKKGREGRFILGRNERKREKGVREFKERRTKQKENKRFIRQKMVYCNAGRAI